MNIVSKEMTDETRCCKIVNIPGMSFGFFRQCKRKWVVERDGKRYCKIHDPVEIEKKDKERQREWDKKWEEAKEASRRNAAIIKACEGVPTEVLEKIKVKDFLAFVFKFG